MGPNVTILVPVDSTVKVRLETCELSAIVFPEPSFRTRVAVAVPPAVKELELKTNVDWAGDIDPVLTVRVGSVLVTAAALTVAVRVVALPAPVAVKVAV